MNYRETLDFLFTSLPMYQRIGKAAYKADLNNTVALDSALGHPHRRFRTIHVAGTNGKGSVSHMLASVLQASGYKTGLYTSPHLIDFRERIRVNGEMIGEEDVVRFVEKIRRLIDEISPSFFEMTVAMAFDYFANEDVDIAVIETGMGGRLDSTNIILPEISIITSISMDHTEFLGDTLALIAAEKGGIIKQNVPVISGKNRPEVSMVLQRISKEQEALFLNAEEVRSFRYQTYTSDGLSLFHFFNNYNGREEVIATDLSGSYQSENIPIVLSALDRIKDKYPGITKESIRSGLANVRKNSALRGRWETIGTNPRIICDTAHNAAGVELVMKQLLQTPSKKLHIVWGMVGDKPVNTILPLLPEEAVYYFTQPSIPRAMDVNKLAGLALETGRTGNRYNTVYDAFLAAKAAAEAEDTIFIGGSTFVVADLLTALN